MNRAMHHARNVLAILGMVALVATGWLWFRDRTAGGLTGPLRAEKRLVTVSQIQSFAELQEVRRLMFSTAMVFYRWRALQTWGYDFGEGEWEFAPEVADGVLTVRVPPLRHLDAKVMLVDDQFVARVVNPSWVIDERDLITAFFPEMERRAVIQGRRLLQEDPGVRAVAEASLKEHLRGLLGGRIRRDEIREIRLLEHVPAGRAPEPGVPLEGARPGMATAGPRQEAPSAGRSIPSIGPPPGEEAPPEDRGGPDVLDLEQALRTMRERLAVLRIDYEALSPDELLRTLERLRRE